MVALTMTAEDREMVERMAGSPSLPHRVVEQSRALLRLADGASVRGVAREFDTWPNTVTRWRDRFLEDGPAGIGRIRPGRGRKREISCRVVEAVVADTLTTVPEDGSAAWTTRSMAARHGIGKDTVAAIWRARELRPWQVDTFKLSTDPEFEAKLVDIVGLYNDPPERAAVFCFDEKTQVQALDRTQPSLPMTPGRAGTMTHDYRRHGTVDLFAAMNLATGEVLHDLRDRHTGRDVLAFFKWIDLHVPAELDIHVVLDNLSAHKSETVRRWLNHPRRARWHLHFTPTSSSWLNLIETWFSILTRRILTNTSFGSRQDLIDTIDTWASFWNHNPEPFVWTTNAEDIIAKVRRGRAALDDVTKSATHH
jgi:transposase